MAPAKKKRHIGILLRERRLAIDPNATRIGAYRRLAQRVGRFVTQEEVAEALGISREWYSRLENGTLQRLSTHLARRVAEVFALSPAALDHRGTATGLRSEALGAFSDLRRFIKRVIDAPSFAEAAEQGVKTLERIVRPDCVAIATLHTDDGPRGYAVGERARYWTPLSHEMVLEALTDALHEGGVAVGNSLPLAQDVSRGERAVASFTRTDVNRAYQHEFNADRWREFNEKLRARSGLAVPLFCGEQFAGILAAGWTRPHAVEESDTVIAETIAGILRLASVCRDGLNEAKKP